MVHSHAYEHRNELKNVNANHLNEYPGYIHMYMNIEMGKNSNTGCINNSEKQR